MEKIGEKRKVWACGEKAALAAAKGFLEVAASAWEFSPEVAPRVLRIFEE
jgi:hypothetical protein